MKPNPTYLAALPGLLASIEPLVGLVTKFTYQASLAPVKTWPMPMKSFWPAFRRNLVCVGMSEFKFSCSHCQQHLQAAEQLAGHQIQCPSCHHLIRIPSAPGSTAQFNPKSGMTWDTFVPSCGSRKNSFQTPLEIKR